MAMLDGKVAIVTGAGRGVGRGEAIALARAGAKVVVNDYGGGFDGTGKATGPAEDVCKEIRAFGGEAVPNFDDVSNFAAAKAIIDTAINSFGKLNILVNNAGILRDKMLFNMTEEEWDAVIAIHLKGTFNCTRHACAYWRAEHKAGNIHGGRIINTVSDAGLLGNPGQTNYGAAKAAIAAFTVITGKEMARYEVTCNAIAPAARTRLTTDATPSLAPMMEKMPAAGQFDLMDPENIAPLIVYLASDDAKDTTSEVFRIYGDRVWLLRGWHTIDTVAKGQAKWTPEELAPVIKGMLAKAPPKPDMMDPFKEAGAI
jgi:NAD(P)-dependent dehydrogenase (short-subunit alcohol dehydrogenase family)